MTEVSDLAMTVVGNLAMTVVGGRTMTQVGDLVSKGCHCERSVAIHAGIPTDMDCRVASLLAVTSHQLMDPQ